VVERRRSTNEKIDVSNMALSRERRCSIKIEGASTERAAKMVLKMLK
jgi:hypothetical protein